MLSLSLDQRDVIATDVMKLHLGEEVAVANLGATAHNIILSSANPVAATLPRHVTLFAGSRRPSYSASHSGVGTPTQRPPQSRAASISSHADGLRRQLASRNSSSAHLTEQRQVVPPPVAAISDSLAQASDRHQAVPSLPMAPPSSVASATLLGRGRLGINGIGAAKVAPAVASDLSPATGTVITETSDSVADFSDRHATSAQRRGNGGPIVRRFESTYGERSCESARQAASDQVHRWQ